jgi:hypothetical protein
MPVVPQSNFQRFVWLLNPVGVGLLAGNLVAFAGVFAGFYSANTAWPILPLVVVWAAVTLAWPKKWDYQYLKAAAAVEAEEGEEEMADARI